MKELDDSFYILWAQLCGSLDFISKNYHKKNKTVVEMAFNLSLQNIEKLNEYLLINV